LDERMRRIGENEAIFRQVNEELAGLNEAFSYVTEVMVLVCECGNLDCSEQIEMSHREYEQIRSDPTLFAVKPGHETAGVEEVVRTADDFNVVRKATGPPRRLAEANDPRR
jgi:hypothetical protein